MPFINKKLIYIIQEHWATHHHFDLRLQIGNILKSWAIPKQPPEKEEEKRLAVETEDHALEYGKFEGLIGEGMYGVGKVKIWDKGFYEPEEIADKKIVVNIKGKKLKGKYCLIKFKGKNWLFFKRKA